MPAGMRIITVGKVVTNHFSDALDDYLTRIRRFMPIELESVKNLGLKRETPGQVRRAKAGEGEGIIKRLDAKDRLIALDRRGKRFSSEKLADWLDKRIEEPGGPLCFVIGGAWGLDEAVLEKARWRLSLGDLTLAHELCAVVLAEQIFRALTIIRGVPYHK